MVGGRYVVVDQHNEIHHQIFPMVGYSFDIIDAMNTSIPQISIVFEFYYVYTTEKKL